MAKDLNKAIHGDLLTTAFSAGELDVIYSSYVLEHLRGAERALDQFVEWLRPGGMIVVRIPDGMSAYGTITKLSPHWFHVFYYRWVMGNKMAGRPGYPPYKTIFDDVVSVQGIWRYASTRGLEIVSAARTRVATKSGWKGMLVRAVLLAVRVLTFGSRSNEHCTITFVLKRPVRSALRGAQ